MRGMGLQKPQLVFEAQNSLRNFAASAGMSHTNTFTRFHPVKLDGTASFACLFS
jgi:hypothetical protein